MKSELKNLIPVMVLLIVFFTGCQKVETNAMSATDAALLASMKTSYENARILNDSMKILDKTVSVKEYYNCDSLFHQCINRFDSIHQMYSHHNSHDDHYHNSMGMHMMSNMMGMHHTDWVDGHHKAEHDMMDNMTTEHNSMFHK
jgi:hypothetical protein